MTNNYYTFDRFMLLGLSIILCLMVEILYPYFNHKYTFDIYDFIPYALGGVYFQFFINQNRESKQ